MSLVVPKIDFHPTQLDYLKKTEFLSNDLRKQLDKVDSSTSRHVIVDISIESVDLLRDEVASQMQKVGFGPDWEPTGEGLMLESLIDVLHLP